MYNSPSLLEPMLPENSGFCPWTLEHSLCCTRSPSLSLSIRATLCMGDNNIYLCICVHVHILIRVSRHICSSETFETLKPRQHLCSRPRGPPGQGRPPLPACAQSACLLASFFASLPTCLCLSPFISMTVLYLPISISLSLSVCLYFSVSVSVSLCLSLPVCLRLSLVPRRSVCLLPPGPGKDSA